MVSNKTPPLNLLQDLLARLRSLPPSTWFGCPDPYIVVAEHRATNGDRGLPNFRGRLGFGPSVLLLNLIGLCFGAPRTRGAKRVE